MTIKLTMIYQINWLLTIIFTVTWSITMTFFFSKTVEVRQWKRWDNYRFKKEIYATILRLFDSCNENYIFTPEIVGDGFRSLFFLEKIQLTWYSILTFRMSYFGYTYHHPCDRNMISLINCPDLFKWKQQNQKETHCILQYNLIINYGVVIQNTISHLDMTFCFQTIPFHSTWYSRLSYKYVILWSSYSFCALCRIPVPRNTYMRRIGSASGSWDFAIFGARVAPASAVYVDNFHNERWNQWLHVWYEILRFVLDKCVKWHNRLGKRHKIGILQNKMCDK